MIDTGDVELKVIEGFKVTVSSYRGTFEATKGEVKLSAETLPKLEELIKEHQREQRRFKPIEVIEVGHDHIGRISSRVADDDASVYFAFKESPNVKATRKAERLEPYSWGHKEQEHNFVLATPENLAILEQINAKLKEQAKIENDLRQLRGSYKDPVTWEIIDKQAGAE